MSVQSLIANIQNELRALKVSTPLNYGQLKFSTGAPTANYSGSFPTASQEYVAMRLEATFTRTDGETTTPLVDLAFDYSVSPNYQQMMQQLYGITISGADPNAVAEFNVGCYVNSTTNNSVTFFIDFLNAFAAYQTIPASVSVNVQAISPITGTLTLRRTI